MEWKAHSHISSRRRGRGGGKDGSRCFCQVGLEGFCFHFQRTQHAGQEQNRQRDTAKDSPFSSLPNQKVVKRSTTRMLFKLFYGKNCFFHSLFSGKRCSFVFLCMDPRGLPPLTLVMSSSLRPPHLVIYVWRN